MTPAEFAAFTYAGPLVHLIKPFPQGNDFKTLGEAFVANFHQVDCVTTLPLTLMVPAIAAERASRLAMVEVTGCGDVAIADDVRALVDAAYRRILTEITGTKFGQERLYADASRHLHIYMEERGGHVEMGCVGILKNAILGSWTAFEVLAEDLYKLASRTAKNPLPRPSDRNGDPMPPSFRSRGKIREAYLAGFQIDGKNINDSMMDVSITALALLRNVLVHNAGKADKDFCKHRHESPLLTSFYHLKEQDSIELDGAVVRSIITQVIESTCQVVEAVDEWLKSH